MYLKVSGNRYPYDSRGEQIELGTIDFSIINAPQISMEHRKILANIVRDTVFTSIRFATGYTYKIATEEYLDSNLEAIKQYHELIADKQRNIEERLKHIGRFWRWLFKLN